MVSVMREHGTGLGNVRKRLMCLAILVVLSALSVVSCAPDPSQPDAATREDFARSVVAAAATGSVEQVEKLVPEVFVNVRPEAERLVHSARGWDPATVELKFSRDFPEFAQVEALQPGATAGIKYEISWGAGHWNLVMGTSSYNPTGNAIPGNPGTGTPKVLDPPK
jgi:hypothetical protein